MPSVEILFEPFHSPKLDLPNRLAMAPMTRGKSPDSVPDDSVVAYYRRRAEGGTGLIITEGTGADHPAALVGPNQPIMYGKGLAGWQKVVDAVHQAGSKIIPQLWQVGAPQRPESDDRTMKSPTPSGLHLSGEPYHTPATEEELADVIGAFARSAKHAKDLGCDGVELHGAHGYLIDQFFWDRTNQRTDQWGGSLSDRNRFAVEAVKAVRAAIGEDMPILMRYSQWKQNDFEAKLAHTPNELSEILLPLAEAGVDIFHCSTRRYWDAEFEGSDLNLAGWTKKITGLPSITVGSVGLAKDFSSIAQSGNIDTAPIHNLLERLEREEFDLVAVGRMLIADPAWANKIRAETPESITPFSRDQLKSLD